MLAYAPVRGIAALVGRDRTFPDMPPGLSPNRGDDEGVDAVAVELHNVEARKISRRAKKSARNASCDGAATPLAIRMPLASATLPSLHELCLREF